MKKLEISGVARVSYWLFAVSCVGFIVFMLVPYQDGYFESTLAHALGISTFIAAITVNFAVSNISVYRHAERPLPTTHFVSCALTLAGVLGAVACALTIRLGEYERYDRIEFYSLALTASNWWYQNGFLFCEIVLFSVATANNIASYATLVHATFKEPASTLVGEDVERPRCSIIM